MGKKGYISEFMNGGRIVSHGKVNDLTNGFKLQGNNPFSIYVRPKGTTTDIDMTLNVQCYQDEEASEAPFTLNDWSPLLVSEISASQNDILSEYDIFWGSGSYVSVNE